MASKYRGEVDNLKSHITTLRVVAGILVFFCALFWWSAKEAKEVQRVHIPPDLRSGSTVQINEIPPTTAYSFALSIFQYLNTWMEDGSSDYPTRVNELRGYLTPSYMEWLQRDIMKRTQRGELLGRTRTVTPINKTAYDQRRVDIINKDNFVVWLDLRIKETHKGTQVKTVDIRYPLKVTRSDVPLDFNPWGMKLDGYRGSPTRITESME